MKAITNIPARKATFAAIVAIAATLALTALVLPSKVVAQQSSQLELTGTTYLNVPSQQLGGPTTEAMLRVEELTTEGSEINLSGEVSYNGNNYPLDLSGTFYKSRLGSPADKVALGTDSSGNFTVLHLAVRMNPPAEALYANPQAKGPVFFLYLVRKDTREATFIETPAVGEGMKIDLTELLQLQREKDHFVLDFWPLILLDTITTSSGSEDGFGTLAVQDNDIHEHWESTTAGPNGECDITYKIKFQGYANGPSGIGISSADYNHTLEILRKWTESNCSFYVEEDSPFLLGDYDDEIDFKVKTYGNDSSRGDVLLKGRYNGNFDDPFSPGPVTFDFHLNYKIASVGFSAPLCSTCTQTPNKNEERVFSQTDPDEWTKLAKYKYIDRRLETTAHYYNGIVQVAWGTGTSSVKPLEAQWYVPIYRDLGSSGIFYTGDTRFPRTVLWYSSGN